MLTRRPWLGVVSGNETEPGRIRSTVRGRELRTGGSFDVESFVLAMAAFRPPGAMRWRLAWR